MTAHDYSFSITPRPPIVPKISPVGPQEMPAVSDPVIVLEPVNEQDIDLSEIPITDPDYVLEQPAQFMFQN